MRHQSEALPQGVQQAGRVEEKEERGKKGGNPALVFGPGSESDQKREKTRAAAPEGAACAARAAARSTRRGKTLQ